MKKGKVIMIEGKFIYKCKNCGEKFLHSAASSYINMELNFNFILKTGLPNPKNPSIGDWPTRFEIHDCDPEVTLQGASHSKNDIVIGVAELIGLYKRYDHEKG